MGFSKQELIYYSSIAIVFFALVEKVNNKLVNTIKKIRDKWREL
jgi:hypothetical protein